MLYRCLIIFRQMIFNYILNTGNPPAALYAYLIYDHDFTIEQHDYAVSHWNAQCEFACAIYLMEDSSLTRSDMIAKLTADGYSTQEAEYACDANDLY